MPSLKEKELIEGITNLKEQIDQLQAMEQELERQGELEKAAEIRYGGAGVKKATWRIAGSFFGNKRR